MNTDAQSTTRTARTHRLALRREAAQLRRAQRLRDARLWEVRAVPATGFAAAVVAVGASVGIGYTSVAGATPEVFALVAPATLTAGILHAVAATLAFLDAERLRGDAVFEVGRHMAAIAELEESYANTAQPRWATSA